VLQERDEQLGVIARLVERARTGVGAVVGVTGPVGVGRTAVLVAAGAAAERAGATVLRARGTPIERGFTLGLARQIAESVPADCGREELALLDELVSDLAGADLQHPDAATTARLQRAFAVLLERIRVPAQENPVVLVVDDHQWSDPASRYWLAHLARRIDRLGVVVLAAVLDGDGGAPGWSASTLHADALTLPLAGLTAASVAAVVSERFGVAGDEAFLAALREAGGRTPAVLHALLDEVVAAGGRPDAGQAVLVRTARPSLLRERLLRTVRAQPPSTRRFLAALGVFDRPVGPELLARLADLDDADRAAAQDSARRLGLVVEDPAPRPAEQVREAVEGLLGAGERRELQLRAAELGRDGALGVEQVAGHLMAATRHGTSSADVGWASGVLRAAAVAAARRAGAPEAVVPLRHALIALPLPDQERAEVLVELATLERDLDMGIALRRVAQAVPLLPDAAARADALVRIPVFALVDLPESLVVSMRDVAGRVAPAADGPDGAARESALALEARVRFLDLADREGLAAAAARYADRLPLPLDTPAERDLATVLVWAAAVAGRIDAARVGEHVGDLLRREPASSSHVHRPISLLVECACMAECSLDDLVPWLEIAVDQATRHALRSSEAVIRAQLAAVLVCSGRRTESEEQLRRAQALLGEGLVDEPLLPDVVLAPLLLGAGDTDLVERTLRRVRPGGRRFAPFDALLQLLRARLAIEAGEFAAALEYCLDCGRRLEQAGRQGVVPLPWRSFAVAVALHLGQREQARALAEADHAESLQWGAPLAVGRSLRLLAATGEPAAAGELLEAALDLLRGCADRSELVGVLRELAAHRREHGGADPALDEEADRCEAALGLPSTSPPLRPERPDRSERVDPARGPAEPSAPSSPSAPPASEADGGERAGRSPGRLTLSERRVAGLAASGITNQDIAEQLGVSVRAVEKHLTSTYRKLGLPGRGALISMWTDARGDGGDRSAAPRPTPDR
jgi:DNA-binding CsgD family transcriptional regulator